MSLRKRRLDMQLHEIAIELALENQQFNHVSIHNVSLECGLSIEEVTRILSKSKLGKIVNYGTDLNVECFFIINRDQSVKLLDKESSIHQTKTTRFDSETQIGKVQQEKEKRRDDLDIFTEVAKDPFRKK